MDRFQAKIEQLYRGLEEAVAEIEQKHPEAHAEIEQCRAKVAEFRRYRRPTTEGEFLSLSQAQTVYLMSIHAIRGQLDRNKMADAMLARRSEQLRSNE